jgi:hypothetical protein
MTCSARIPPMVGLSSQGNPAAARSRTLARSMRPSTAGNASPRRRPTSPRRRGENGYRSVSLSAPSLQRMAHVSNHVPRSTAGVSAAARANPRLAGRGIKTSGQAGPSGDERAVIAKFACHRRAPLWLSSIPRSMPMRRTLRSDPGTECRQGGKTGRHPPFPALGGRSSAMARPARSAADIGSGR